MSRSAGVPSVVDVDVLTAMYADAWSRLSPQVLELVVVPRPPDEETTDARDE